MYENFFGLRERPFDLTPNPRFLLLTPKHREALSNLEFGIASRKGMVVLIGEAGTGKTTLARAVIDKQDASKVKCVYLNNPALTREEFVTVCEWKTSRSRSKVASNDAATVEEATRRALASTDERGRLEALTALEGVGVPTASTLLHFAFPDDYPILDVRALESLGQRSRTAYPVEYWLRYLDACRELALRHGVSIRTLDKALWQHSKDGGVAASARE